MQILNLVNKGEDFDALIKEYGGDLFLFNNDDGYYISRGNYYKAFEDTAFSLEVGETSDIIKIIFFIFVSLLSAYVINILYHLFDFCKQPPLCAKSCPL